MLMKAIRQADPRAGYLAHKTEISAAISRVLESGRYILGAEGTAFEREWAEYVGVAHAIGTGNGTDALELALRALGIGAGDECILPANTFIATAEAVARAGATPVLADCDAYYLIDVDHAATRVGTRSRAILPVH